MAAFEHYERLEQIVLLLLDRYDSSPFGHHQIGRPSHFRNLSHDLGEEGFLCLGQLLLEKDFVLLVHFADVAVQFVGAEQVSLAGVALVVNVAEADRASLYQLPVCFFLRSLRGVNS